MITRLHRALLGALPLPATAQGFAPFDEVHVDAPAIRAFRHQLTAPGSWRTGQLYGRVQDDTLHVTHAAIGGYPVWHPRPLTGTPPYQLGFLDALHAEGHTDLDWCGHWAMRPDNGMSTLDQSAAWLHAGQPRALFDAHTILLSVGLYDERLDAEAFRLLDGRIDILPVTLASL